MTASYQKNQWRMSDRIKLPAWVIIQNQRIDLIDWSFAGFAVSTQTGRFKVEEIVDLTLLLPFHHYTAQCALRAEVRSINENSTGFEFVEVPQSVRLLMREYVEAFVEGRLDGKEAVATNNSSQEQDSRVNQALTAKKDASTPVHETTPLFWRKISVYGVLSVVGMLAIAGLLMSQRYLDSTQAGLVGNTAEVRARSEGYITNIAVKAGDDVTLGQLLVQLDEKEARRNLRAGAYVQQQAQEALATAEKALKGEQLEGKLYSKIANWRHKAEQARVQETDAQLAQAKADLDRAETLFKSGFIAKSALDDRRLSYAQRLAGLGRVNAEAALSADIAQEAKAGRFFSNTQIANRTPELIQVMEQRKAEHAKALLQLGPLFAAVEHTSVVAPQSGKVRIISRAPGELVRAGELVAVIETGQPPTVMAKFTVSDAFRITPGQSVRIFLPAIDQVFDGMVDAVGPQGLVTDAGLANTAEPGKNEVPVTVRFSKPIPLPGGLRAKVEVDTNQNFFTLVRQRLQ